MTHMVNLMTFDRPLLSASNMLRPVIYHPTAKEVSIITLSPVNLVGTSEV